MRAILQAGRPLRRGGRVAVHPADAHTPPIFNIPARRTAKSAHCHNSSPRPVPYSKFPVGKDAVILAPSSTQKPCRNTILAPTVQGATAIIERNACALQRAEPPKFEQGEGGAERSARARSATRDQPARMCASRLSAPGDQLVRLPSHPGGDFIMFHSATAATHGCSKDGTGDAKDSHEMPNTQR